MSYNLSLFVLSIIVISLIPGLNVMLVISQSLQGGLKTCTTSILGIVAGNIVYFMISLLGLGALMMSFPEVFKMVKFAGIAFTIYSAWGLLKIGLKKEVTSQTLISPSTGEKFLQGMLTIISNPKAFVFWITVLPGFVDPRQNVLFQVGVFGVVAIVIDTLILFSYGYLAAYASPFLRNRSHNLQFLISGIILLLVAVWLLLS